MINPGMMMKLMNAKNTFESNHPKFAAFVSRFFYGWSNHGRNHYRDHDHKTRRRACVHESEGTEIRSGSGRGA